MLRLKSRLLSGARSVSLGLSSKTTSIAARSGDGRDGKRVDYLVVAALGIGAMVASGPAMAQANPNCPPDAPPSAQCPAPSSSVETVVVTGSRIPRPEADSPSPVMSVTAQQILHSGDVNLNDYLKRIPALVGSLGDAALNVNAGAITAAHASLEGQNLLELRNLGYIRTLVLQDGQRLVATVAGTQSVDTNTIPITLIQRVDVETAGSSAIYGADAVSGVVNFIMKHDLEGVDSRFQVTVPENGSGNKYEYATSVGHNFDNGNGNITITYEGFYQDNVFFTDVHDMRTGVHAFEEPNPANPLGNIANLPANVPFKNITIPSFGPIGEINALNGQTFTGAGKAFNFGQPIDPFTNDAIGGDGITLESASFADFQPIEHRSIAEISGDEQFNHWFKLSGEFRFVNVNTKTNEENAFWETPVTDQNPFLPANVRAAIASNGTAGLGPQGSAIGLLTEFPFDIPGTNLQDKTSRNIYRVVLGLDGDFPLPSFFHDARYDLHYVYGQTDETNQNDGDLVDDRLAAALDVVTDPATGKPTCRSNLFPNVTPPDLSAFGLPVLDAIVGFPTALFGSTFTPGPNSGCAPFNPFDPKADNRAAIKFIYLRPTFTSVITQRDLNGFLRFDLPQVQDFGMAGPWAVVLGGEWREETSKNASPPDTIAGAFGPGAPSPFFGQGGPLVAGKYHVTEAFGELNMPVLADVPFVKELSFDVAGRVSDYSTAGTNETWKMSGVWSPISGVKFRGVHSYSVRAPSIGELFSPLQVAFGGVTDPCDAPNVNAGTQFRVQNCTTLLHALGVTNYVAGQTSLLDQTTIQLALGGNAKLAPETARTDTLGVVLQPDFIPDLTLTVDWYRVNIRNAIEEPSASAIASECVDLTTINNPFCAQVTRTPTAIPNFAPPGGITNIREVQLNVAQFLTQGTDFTASYHANLDDWFDMHLGTLDLHLQGSHLDALEFTPLQGQPTTKEANVASGGFDGGHAPYWQVDLEALWTFDKWTFDYNVLWENSMLNTGDRQTLRAEPNILPKNLLRTPPTNLHSVSVSYEVEDGWNLYAGINNLWNQKPQFTHSTIPVDPFGRLYYAGVKVDIQPW